jgi:hypothetical protein
MKIVAKYRLDGEDRFILCKNVTAFYYFYANKPVFSRKTKSVSVVMPYFFVNAIKNKDNNLIIINQELWFEYEKWILACSIIGSLNLNYPYRFFESEQKKQNRISNFFNKWSRNDNL